MKSFRVFAGAISLMTASSTLAAGEMAAAPPIKAGAVTWLSPTAPVPASASDAEKKGWMQDGRAPPPRELLQPTLDPALPAYVPTKGLRLNAKLRAGSSDVLPALVEGWVRAFRRYHPGFNLTIARPLAGSLGTVELIKGNVDLVFVSRELKPTDISTFRDRFGHDPSSVPISGGSWRQFGFLDTLAVVVHPSNPVRKLSFRQLDSAMSSTRFRGAKEARTWGDLGVTGEWADKPVHLYGIQPWNGFEEFVRQRVLSYSGKRGEWSDRMSYDTTISNIARRVAVDPYALGYTGISAVDSEVKIVPLSVTDDGAPVAPDYENVASAVYPLTRVIFLNFDAQSAVGRSPATREFLSFILSKEGQEVVLQQGVFLPLRASQIAAVKY